MAAASMQSTTVLIDECSLCLQRLLQYLVRTAEEFPRSLRSPVPKLVLSVIACDHTSVLRCIVHNVELTLGSLSEILQVIERRCCKLEDEIMNFPLDISSSDASFIIACALLAHDRMPAFNCPITFLLTDGVLSAPDIGTFDSVFASIASKDIMVHSVILTSKTSHFGFVPDPDFLDMVSQYSGGLSLTNEDFSLSVIDANALIFCKKSGITRSVAKSQLISSLFCLKVKEYLLDVNVGALLCCRIKEGFKNGRVSNVKAGGFSISLALVWKPIVTVEYTVQIRHLDNPRVVIKVIAPDEFLRKLQVLQKSKKHRSPTVTISTGPTVAPQPLILLERLSNIVKTDQLLALLHCLELHDIVPADPLHPAALLTLSKASDPSLLSKILSFSPTMWKRWLTVRRIDMLCHLPPNSFNERQHINESINFRLASWSSSVHGKVYIKSMTTDVLSTSMIGSTYWSSGHSPPIPICLIRVFWHSATLATLYIGFTSTVASDIETELSAIKDALCVPDELSSIVTFPYSFLGPTLLRLDPSDGIYAQCFQSGADNDDGLDPAEHDMDSMGTTLSARSRSFSNPNFISNLSEQEASSLQATPAAVTSHAVRPDISKDSVESSLPKAILRSFMNCCQRTYKIYRPSTLQSFFQYINSARIQDGFQVIVSEPLSSTSYFAELEISAGRMINFQFAICITAPDEILIESWLDPDEPNRSLIKEASEAFFDRIVSYFDSCDVFHLQAIRAFYAIVECSYNSQPFMLSCEDSLTQYNSKIRVNRCTSECFSEHNIDFDMVPLIRCSRPCIVPLRFPKGLSASQTSVYESLSRIPVLTEIIPGSCFAHAVSPSLLTLAVVMSDALFNNDFPKFYSPTTCSSLHDWVMLMLPQLQSVTEEGKNTSSVAIFEVCIEDVISYRMADESALNGVKDFATVPASDRNSTVHSHKCAHSSEINELRRLIEKSHSAHFIRGVFSDILFGNAVPDEDLRTAFSSCTEYRNHIDITKLLHISDSSIIRRNLQKFLQSDFKAIPNYPSHFIYTPNRIFNDNADESGDDSDEETLSKSSHDLHSDNSIGQGRNPFFCRIEIVSKPLSGTESVVPICSCIFLSEGGESDFAGEVVGQVLIRVVVLTPPDVTVDNPGSPKVQSGDNRRMKLQRSNSVSVMPSFVPSQASSVIPLQPVVHHFSSLPANIRRLISAAFRKLKSIISDQLLHALFCKHRTSKPEVLANVMPEVQRHFQCLSKTFRQKVIVPLEYVVPTGSAFPIDVLFRELRTFISIHLATPTCFVSIESGCWVLITISDDVASASIIVHAREGSIESPYLVIHQTLVQCIVRVNQLGLLEHMRLTRSAPQLLIPVDPGEFQRSKYSCPCIITHRLRLHSRLTIPVALRALSETTLHPFSVSDRRFVYVYQQENGSIFYLRLSSSDSPVEANEETAFILLEVFGINSPDEETRLHFPELLQSRLNAMVLSLLSSLLSRNQNFKWGPTDLHLIRPYNSSPTKAIHFPLPADINRDAFFFLLLNSQAFLRSFLMTLHYLLHDNLPYSLEDDVRRWSWRDFSFVYNFDGRFASSKSVDHGVALVFGSLATIEDSMSIIRSARSCSNSFLPSTNSSGVVAAIPLDPIAGGISPMASVQESCCSTDSTSELSLLVEIWALGTVDIDFVIQELSVLVNQAIMQYRIEKTWQYYNAKSLPFCQISSLLSQALPFQDPTVRVTEFHLRLATWALPLIVDDLQAMLVSIHDCFSAQMFLFCNGEWQKQFALPDGQNDLFLVGGVMESGLPPSKFMCFPHIIGAESGYVSAGVGKSTILAHRSSFIIVSLSSEKVQITIYNWKSTLTTQLVKQSSKLLSWCRFRMHLLDNILHQKLGLFRHVSSVPPAPILSSNDMPVYQARFTVDNINVLVDNQTPPRHVFHDVQQPETSAPPNEYPNRKERPLNRFEARRRITASRTHPVLAASAAGNISMQRFGTVLMGQTAPEELCSFRTREFIQDPVTRHGKSFLLVAKRLREEAERVSRRQFCALICEGDNPPVATPSLQLQWIDMICNHAVALKLQQKSFTFQFFMNIDSPVECNNGAVEPFAEEFAKFLSRKEGFDSLISVSVSNSTTGPVRHCLLRKFVVPGLIMLIRLIVSPLTISCDSFLFELKPGVANDDLIQSSITAFEMIDIHCFIEEFHTLQIFDFINGRATFLDSYHGFLDLRGTLTTIYESGSPCLIRISIESFATFPNTFSYLRSNAKRFGLSSNAEYLFNPDFVAFSLSDVFVRTISGENTETGVIVSELLRHILVLCQEELRKEQLWKQLTSYVIADVVKMERGDMQRFHCLNLELFDPSLSRLFDCLASIEPAAILSHLRSSFLNVCNDIVIGDDQLSSLFIGCGDVGVIISRSPDIAFSSVALCGDEALDAQRKLLLAQVVNSCCNLLWRKCFPD